PVEGDLRRDLGDVQIADTRDVEVLVVDDHGRQVVGAIAVHRSTLLGDQVVCDAPSDAAGRMRCHVWGAPAKIHVGALGFASKSAEIVEGPESPLRVVLSPATLLEVCVAGQPSQETPATSQPGVMNVSDLSMLGSSCRLRLDAQGPLFSTENGR